ncbi:MAG: hypothetical protein HQ559_06890, partial [Lentisphaerae bacterium]|nr:hypothetical protein [Lentisphaerota bacterium]
MKGIRLLICLSGLAALPVLGAATSSPGRPTERFRADYEALMGHPHRLSGTAEAAEAVTHVVRRLEAIGVDRIIRQPFPSAQTIVKQCSLRVEDTAGGARDLQILPMRPNGIIPPVTPQGGIRGRIVHGGDGSIGAYGDHSPQGAIVVMDYNCQGRWLRAFRLGAVAVVFTASDDAPSAAHTHAIESDVNLPRFFYSGPRTDLTAGALATLNSAVVWAPARSENVYAYIRGTNPVFHVEREELLVLAAPMDSFGDVPRLSPGGRGAANIAGLLATAEQLVQQRSGRHVLLAFLDNQARGHVGACALYGSLERDYAAATAANRLESIDNEMRTLDAQRVALAQPDPFQAPIDTRRQLQSRAKEKSAEKAYGVNAELVKLRRQRDLIDDGTPQMDSVEHTIAGKIAEKDLCNDLRRYVARLEGPMPPSIQTPLLQVLEEIRVDIAARTGEIELERESAQAAAELDALVGDHWISLHVSYAFGDAADRWGVIIGGDSDWHSHSDKPGLYGKVQAALANASADLGEGAAHFEVASVDGSLQPRLLWGAPYLVHSGEVAGRYGIFNVVLGTTQDRLSYEGTTHDRLAPEGLARIE